MSGYHDHKICEHCGRNDLDPLEACTCPGANKPRAMTEHSQRTIAGFLVEYALTRAMLRSIKSQNDLAKKQAAFIEELAKEIQSGRGK